MQNKKQSPFTITRGPFRTSFALIIALVVCVCQFALPVAAAEDYGSASAWARDAVKTAVANGYVPSDLQSNYKDVITRAEFCRMAVMFMEYAAGKGMDAILEDKDLSRDPNAFNDTSDPYILAAFALGITSGTDSAKKLFAPNGQFSREQAAAMIMNTCKAMGADVSNPPPAGFSDAGSVSSWAVNGVNYCFAKGIMNGTSTNPPLFSPKTAYTREQSIVTFNNIKTDVIMSADTASGDYITIKGEQYSTGLTELDLGAMELTDADIEPLRHMTNLKELILFENNISDISSLTGLTGLTKLDLRENNISDIGPMAGLT
jgi:hypothetical protein